jgi:hypothetical protein
MLFRRALRLPAALTIARIRAPSAQPSPVADMFHRGEKTASQKVRMLKLRFTLRHCGVRQNTPHS